MTDVQQPARPFSTEVGVRILASACDIAVMRCLELVGKRVARDDRSHYGAMKASGKAWHEVHEMWSPSPSQLDAALVGAWVALPRLNEVHGCCGVTDNALAVLLNGYVRELVAAKRPHSFEELRERLADAVAQPR